MITAEEVHARMERGAQAAAGMGRDLGLEVSETIVLHNAFSVVVHLSPSPVVARVPLVVPPGMEGDALLVRQQRELDFVGWLAGTGLAVVRPSPLVPARPYVRDGFAMTFWELADLASDHVPYGSIESSRVVDLHEAMRGYPGELPFLSSVTGSVPGLLEALQRSPELIEPADLERALAEWEMLEPLFASAEAFLGRFPNAVLQPAHGDSPSYNAIRTTGGILFADFEDISLAPLELDLALGTEEDLQGYKAEAGRRGLPSYDEDVLRVMNAVRFLQMVGSLAMVPQLPILENGLKPAIEAWRGSPFAGGVEGVVPAEAKTQQ